MMLIRDPQRGSPKGTRVLCVRGKILTYKSEKDKEKRNLSPFRYRWSGVRAPTGGREGQVLAPDVEGPWEYG